MTNIKLIKPDTDLSKIRLTNLDLVLYDKPYNVYRVEGYNHTIRGYEPINLWTCPSDEEPTYQNLIQFSGKAPTWGITFEETNYIKSKWYETEIRKSGVCWITRNGEKFYCVTGRDMDYCLAKAQYFLVRLMEEIPFYFHERNWQQQAIGMKIWYDNKPAVIGGFSSDNEIRIVDENDNFIGYEDMLSSWIKWFRD